MRIFECSKHEVAYDSFGCPACKLESALAAALERERVLRGMLIHPLPNGETDVGGNGTWIGRYQTYQAAEAALAEAVKEKGGAK